MSPPTAPFTLLLAAEGSRLLTSVTPLSPPPFDRFAHRRYSDWLHWAKAPFFFSASFDRQKYHGAVGGIGIEFKG